MSRGETSHVKSIFVSSHREMLSSRGAHGDEESAFCLCERGFDDLQSLVRVGTLTP